MSLNDDESLLPFFARAGLTRRGAAIGIGTVTPSFRLPEGAELESWTGNGRAGGGNSASSPLGEDGRLSVEFDKVGVDKEEGKLTAEKSKLEISVVGTPTGGSKRLSAIKPELESK